MCFFLNLDIFVEVGSCLWIIYKCDMLEFEWYCLDLLYIHSKGYHIKVKYMYIICITVISFLCVYKCVIQKPEKKENID